jgi:hypothetical protein
MGRKKRSEAFEDMDDGDDGRGRQGGIPAWAWVAASVFLALCLTVAVGVAGFVMLARSPAKPPPPPTAAAVKPLTRQQFKEKVMGKTPEAVLKAVGKPAGTRGDAKDDGTWTYEEVALDPISGRVDFTTYVDFRKGVVAQVSP